jgi:AcrR family transcriptional regulator
MRAETAAATRQRILKATMALHDEQGITRTSVRDVAGRAGVSPATVLRHFSNLDGLIRACGQLTDQLLPMPDRAVLIGARNRGEAVRLMALALFAWYEKIGRGLEQLQIDARTLPEVDEWQRRADRHHRELVAAALGPEADASAIALVAALTCYGAWRSLRDAGMDSSRAAAELAGLVAGASQRPLSFSLDKERVH